MPSRSAFWRNLIFWLVAIGCVFFVLLTAVAMVFYPGNLLPGCYNDWIAPAREQFIGALDKLIVLLPSILAGLGIPSTVA